MASQRHEEDAGYDDALPEGAAIVIGLFLVAAPLAAVAFIYLIYTAIN